MLERNPVVLVGPSFTGKGVGWERRRRQAERKEESKEGTEERFCHFIPITACFGFCRV